MPQEFNPKILEELKNMSLDPFNLSSQKPKMSEQDVLLEVLEERKRAEPDDPKDPIELMIHNSRKYHELKKKQKAEREARLEKAKKDKD